MMHGEAFDGVEELIDNEIEIVPESTAVFNRKLKRCSSYRCRPEKMTNTLEKNDNHRGKNRL
jgi:hypothetical protein